MVTTTHLEPSQSANRLRAPLLIIAAVVGLAIVIRVMSLIGYQGQDDRNYLAYAQYVASGHDVSTLTVANQWVGRLGFWLPIAGFIRVAGASQLAYVAYPLLVSIAGVLLTFALASATVGRRAGALAALLLAIFPLDVLYATRAYPDVPLGVFMVASYWLALKGRTSLPFAALAGLALGLAYLQKETALFALVPLAVALRFWDRRQWGTLAVLALSLAVVVGAELAFWTMAKGDPLYRFSATGAALNAASPEASTASNALFGFIPGPRPFDAYRSDNTILDAVLMLATNEELVLLYWLVLPLIALGAITRDRETRDLRLWILFLLPMILFLPVVPPYHTMPRDPRYLTCLTIPALLILAAYVRRMPSRAALLVIAVFAATGALGILLGKESSRMEPQLTLLQKARQGERLWVSPQFAADVVFLSGVDRNLPIGIHLLQQRRTAGSFEAVTLVRPDLPIAEDLQGIPDGLLVLREQPKMPDVGEWALAERLTPRPSWPVMQVQRLLGMVGLQSYARKLDPGGGTRAVVYRRRPPPVSL